MNDGPPFDAWLAARREALTADVTDALDLDAGLREATLGGRHAAMVGELAESLDVEGGLAAIVGTAAEYGAGPGAAAAPESGPESGPESAPAPAPQQGATPAPAPPRWKMTTAARTALAAVPPSQRLALRDHRVRDAAICAALTLTAVDLLNGVVTQKRPRTRIWGLARRLSAAMRYAAHLDGRLFPSLDPHLATVADAGAGRRAEDAAHLVAIRLARLLDSTILRTLEEIRRSALGVRHAGVLQEAEILASVVSTSLGMFDPGSPAGEKLQLLREVLHMAGLADRRLTAHLLPRLDIPPPSAIALELLDDRFADDFTTADLRDADLAGLDLTGVRWSPRGTRWPPTLDVTDLLNRSEEDPPGSGVYVVRRFTGRGAREDSLV